MRALKSLPYVLCATMAMGFVAFSTMSVVVLKDMAETRGETAGAMTVLLTVPITQLGKIPVKI